jgi:ADP-ribosyl-[dinitrogen reductase] hydrolase
MEYFSYFSPPNLFLQRSITIIKEITRYATIFKGVINLLNKIKGGLFGVAVGDALGVSAEFLDPIQIKHLYGYITEITGGGIFSFEKGEVSDDTDMTLAVARGILQQPDNPYANIGKEFLKWKETFPKDIGNTIDHVLTHYDGDWFYAAEQAHVSFGGRSAGNGSLMRVLPVTLFYSDINEATRVAYYQSKMTHHDELASEACVLYTKIANHLLNGKSLAHSIKKEVEGTRYEVVLHGEPSGNPDGFVVNSLQWSLYYLLSTSSFEELVQHCVNAGYDADTTAAIAGGLAGIYYGFEGIPTRYINTLLKKDEIEQICLEIEQNRK